MKYEVTNVLKQPLEFDISVIVNLCFLFIRSALVHPADIASDAQSKTEY